MPCGQPTIRHVRRCSDGRCSWQSWSVVLLADVLRDVNAWSQPYQRTETHTATTNRNAIDALALSTEGAQYPRFKPCTVLLWRGPLLESRGDEVIETLMLNRLAELC